MEGMMGMGEAEEQPMMGMMGANEQNNMNQDQENKGGAA